MRKRYWLVAMSTLLSGIAISWPAMAQSTVLELFTSQGCSSCPPADASMSRLAIDPALVVLSFHVNYWDSLGWKDPYASQLSTNRQYAYGKAMGSGSVFTPQLIINGTDSMVGSQEGSVSRGIETAQKQTLPVQAALTPQTDGSFSLTLSGPAPAADVWEVRFVRHAMTKIGAGENGGRNLESVNNVTGFRRLGPFSAGSTTLPALQGQDDGVAIIVQAPGPGKVLGAALYTKN